MGFGKKKKQNKEIQQKPETVSMDNNPLYPPKTESEGKEILTALGTTVVCLALVGLIFSNFSYAAGNQPPSSPNTDITVNESPDTAYDTSSEEMIDEGSNVAADEIIDSDYIIADSNSRYISSSELDRFSQEELSHARNEIYARHGRRFKDAALQSYFDSKEWYNGTIEPEQFSESMLNEYEKKNAETILSYEQAKGYR